MEIGLKAKLEYGVVPSEMLDAIVSPEAESLWLLAIEGHPVNPYAPGPVLGIECPEPVLLSSISIELMRQVIQEANDIYGSDGYHLLTTFA